MASWTCIVVLHLCWSLLLCESSHTKRNYVIEVQDHQQALKHANPIVDLEDTVRRGISDPLADPRFVINSINSDFFGNPMSGSLNGDELVAFHGGNLASNRIGGSIIGVNTNVLGLHADQILQQHAVKEEIVPRHPSSVATFEDSLPAVRHPGLRQFHGQLQGSLQDTAGTLHQNFQDELPSEDLSSLAFRGSLKDATPLVQGGQTLQSRMHSGLPNRMPANRPNRISMYSNLKQAPSIRGDLSTRKVQSLPSYLIDTLRRNPYNRQTLHFPEHVNLPGSSNNINPLTGLPEDLEDRSYGAVSSVTVAENPPQQIPSSITVNAGGGAEVITQPSADSASHSAALERSESYHSQASETSTHADVAPASSDQVSGKEIEGNFSALKSFLEADDILRDNLDRNGVDADRVGSKTMPMGNIHRKHRVPSPA